MKNFDIEQLERKNIYKTPGDFFAGMQENVLKQTVHQTPTAETARPEGKTIPMKTNWIYAAAAALALLLGVGFFIKNTNAAPENPQPTAASTLKTETPITQTTAGEQPQLMASEVQKPDENVTQDLTFEKTEYQTVRREPQVIQVKSFANVTEKSKAAPSKAERIKREDVDQILTSFTSSELAEMSKDAEMDVYLDLFN